MIFQLAQAVFKLTMQSEDNFISSLSLVSRLTFASFLIKIMLDIKAKTSCKLEYFLLVELHFLGLILDSFT